MSDNITIFQNGKEEAYHLVREALGQHNDKSRPVTDLVEILVDENTELHSQLRAESSVECHHNNWEVKDEMDFLERFSEFGFERDTPTPDLWRAVRILSRQLTRC